MTLRLLKQTSRLQKMSMTPLMPFVSNVTYANKVFTNTIKDLKGTDVTLTFHKMLHGRDLKDGEFMFAL